MTEPLLVAAHGKIKRAEAHINQLEREIATFISKNPYKVVTEVNSNKVKVWSFAPDSIPLPIQNVAADAAYNLRAPLDKMLTAFKVKRERGGRTRFKGIGFPVGESRHKFESALSEQKKKLPADVIKFLSETEAYPGGKGALLFALHDLNIEDKHHPFLTPVNLGVRAVQTTGLDVYFAPLYTIGSRRGHHLVWNPTTRQLVQHNEGQRPTIRRNPVVFTDVGQRIEFRTPYDDFEFATTAPETALQYDVKPLLNVAFHQVQGLEGEPVVSALHQMRQLVEGILLTFEKRFF